MSKARAKFERYRRVGGHRENVFGQGLPRHHKGLGRHIYEIEALSACTESLTEQRTDRVARQMAPFDFLHGSWVYCK